MFDRAHVSRPSGAKGKLEKLGGWGGYAVVLEMAHLDPSSFSGWFLFCVNVLEGRDCDSPARAEEQTLLDRPPWRDEAWEATEICSIPLGEDHGQTAGLWASDASIIPPVGCEGWEVGRVCSNMAVCTNRTAGSQS